MSSILHSRRPSRGKPPLSVCHRWTAREARAVRRCLPCGSLPRILPWPEGGPWLVSRGSNKTASRASTILRQRATWSIMNPKRRRIASGLWLRQCPNRWIAQGDMRRRGCRSRQAKMRTSRLTVRSTYPQNPNPVKTSLSKFFTRRVEVRKPLRLQRVARCKLPSAVRENPPPTTPSPDASSGRALEIPCVLRVVSRFRAAWRALSHPAGDCPARVWRRARCGRRT